MVKKESPTGLFAYFEDADGNGSNKPVLCDQYGNLVMVETAMLKSSHSGNANETINQTGKAIAISNDGGTDLTVMVNGIVSTIKAGEFVGPDILNFGSFTSIAVTTTANYRMWIYG